MSAATSASPFVSALVTRHKFYAICFAENFRMKSLAARFAVPHKGGAVMAVPFGGGTASFFPFGVVVLQDVPATTHAELLTLVKPHLDDGGKGTLVAEESFEVQEDAAAKVSMNEGHLMIDALNADRAGVIALTLAQSVAMEYYEAIIEKMSEETGKLVERLRRHGSAPHRIRKLHKFIGEAVSTRNEVLSVLHLLDKPDATWEDAAMNRIYDDLRAEFDLSDRFSALETRLRSLQEALELILDVVRDRRLVFLEATIVVLILIEILMTAPSWFR